CDMIKEINSLGLKSCASLGILTPEQARQLKNAGLVRYHHNINTAKSYYKEVSTTHTYEDRINTIKNVRAQGLELCCGTIVGLGESREQRVEMALALAEIAPESIPFNILMPILGTPYEGYFDKIDEEDILRTLSIFKIANPGALLRLCGGRNTRLSEENCELALKTSVEGILIGNYLTTLGISPQDDLKTMERLGKICMTT
ncbi:biotin synthase, partial [Candidatus Gastranaerophilus sp. (ex Termes propinquus)]